jgi:hypothetical protein
MLEGALKTIAVSMANCEFYASIFSEALNRQFTSPGTTAAWEKQLERALPEFYGAVLVFSIKVKSYFIPFATGKLYDRLIGISVAHDGHHRTVRQLPEAVFCELPTPFE